MLGLMLIRGLMGAPVAAGGGRIVDKKSVRRSEAWQQYMRCLV
jgi:hypothetical protein